VVPEREQAEQDRAVIRRGHLMAVVVGAFLVGCAVLLMTGASGTRAEAPQEEKQGRAEAAKDQEHSGGASPQEDRCGGTRINDRGLTNDVPGCPTGGLLTGTEGADILTGEKGQDEVRAFGTPDAQADELYGGPDDDVLRGGTGMDFLYGEQDDDVLYGGDGADILLVGGKGADVIHGGDGSDLIDARGDKQPRQPDKLYCGKGEDRYDADKMDHVDSSCEKKAMYGPAIF
jgi:hypothetical protein